MDILASTFAIACLFMAFLSLMGITPATIFVGIATPWKHRIELAIRWLLGAIIFILMDVYLQ